MSFKLGLGFGLAVTQTFNLAPGTTVDLFVVIGESGAEGRAVDYGPNILLANTSNTGFYITGSTITSPLSDPVGSALNRSMWPTFANKWFELTGRACAFVEQATGGSAVHYDSSPSNNWASNGALRNAALTAANSAISAIQGDSSKSLGNVYFLLELGRNDAGAIASATANVTQANVTNAFIDLFDSITSSVPLTANIGVFKTGFRNDRANSVSYQMVRDAIETACSARPKARILTRIESSFPADAMAQHKDSDHMISNGLYSKAVTAAIELNKSTETPYPSAPQILAIRQLNDATVMAPLSQVLMPNTHSTAIGTKSVFIVTAHHRLQSSSDVVWQANNSFNGVIMKKVGGDIAGATTNPGGRVEVVGYIMNETEYGGPGSLNNLTNAFINVRVTSTAADYFNAFVVDLDREVVIDQIVAPTIQVANAAGTLTKNFTIGANCAVIAACGYSGNSTVANGATMNLLTQSSNVSNTNGITAAGFVSGYGNLTENTYSIQANFLSLNVKMAAMGVYCLREKVDGEIIF